MQQELLTDLQIAPLEQIVAKQKELGGFFYVATPYTKYVEGHHQAWHDAVAVTVSLMKHGIEAFSPIVHSHHLAYLGGLDAEDGVYWAARCKPFLDAASGLLLAGLPGWEESAGCKVELAEMRAQGKPAWFIPVRRGDLFTDLAGSELHAA